MATKSINTRIQLKYDSYENWSTNNPTLLSGEIAIATIAAADNQAQNPPTVLFKVGPGAFNSLSWASGLAADVYSWAKKSGIEVTASGTGNVVASISWDSENKKLVYTTASVATSEGLASLQEALDALTSQVNAMYTNEQIDEKVADAKAAGTSATTALNEYKTSNDSALAAVKAKAEANEDAIGVLNGSGDGSVSKQVADAVAGIVNGAPEAYDTLKEISDWITNHADSAATMNSNIADNATAIANEKTRAEAAEAALQEDIDSLETAVAGKAAAEHTHAIADVTGLQTAIDNALQDAKDYADANDSDTTYTAADNGGLKLTGTEFAIDDSVTFVLNCGSSSTVLD